MSNRTNRGRLAIILAVVVFLALAGLMSCRQSGPSVEEASTGFNSLQLSGNLVVSQPTNAATGTPGIYVNNAAVGAGIAVMDSGTPVWSVNNGGAVVGWGAQTINGNLTIGADAAGFNVIAYSATAGDNMTWSAADKKLTLTGTNATTALDVADGNVVVNDDLTVTAGAFDVTAGATSLEALTVGVDATGADVTFYSNTAGDNMTWSAAGPTLTILGTNAVTALDVSDGNAIVNDNLTVTAGNLAVTAGTLTVGGTTALAADVTLATDPTGGNALAKNEYIGLPRITLAPLGTMVNGTTNTVLTDIGGSETPATDWTAIDADTVMTNDAAVYRQGTASLKMAVAITADDGDGCTNALASGDQNWTDDEGFGFWFRASKALDAGDITLQIHDVTAAGGFTDVNLPAYTTPDVWVWTELDVTLGNNNLKDVTTDLSFTLSAAGAAQAAISAFDVYFDFIVKWDVGDEDALPQAIPYDGVLSLIGIDVTSGGAATSTLVEYQDYFCNYQSGADAIVMITDQSATDLLGLALIAY